MPKRPSLNDNLPPLEDPIVLLNALIRDVAKLDDQAETTVGLLKNLQRLLDILEPEEGQAMRPAVKLRAILLSLSKTLKVLGPQMTSAKDTLVKQTKSVEQLTARVEAQALEILSLKEALANQVNMTRQLMQMTALMRQDLGHVLSLLPVDDA